MNRDLRCQLDLLKPPQKSSVSTKILKETVKKAQAKQKRGHDQTASERNAIRPYDMVLVRHAQMPKWRNARVVQVFGERYYTVQYTDAGVRQKVHVDHLRLHPRSNQLPTQQLVQDEPDLEPRDVEGSNRDNKRDDQFSSDTERESLDDGTEDELRAPEVATGLEQPRRSQRTTKAIPPTRYGEWTV
ncbi:uncharacterized protein LOC134180273 [Corticium candelabrum]|uniref:uncharacterized protein LOC134180273 n=1 Tax=Corticium candelabrum TaxID=121492 RepID=UPI002E265C30|nr:uncharacterized protein LOC134180273 [Corticium candelabrum]